MKAVVAPRHGGPDVLVVSDIPSPPMVPGGVRVAIAAASVNFPDVLTIAGKYQVKTEPPFVPGCEFCGRVVEVASDVTTLEPGAMVFGLGVSGVFAEETVVDASQLTRVPDDVDPIAAAAFGVVYLTGYHALRTIARVQPGEWVVVLGAGGGVGLATVELAHVMGAKVLACASDDEKLAAARAKGADAILDYSREDLKVGIKTITGGGADVVVDPVGGQYSELALRATRWGGRFVVAGFASGEIPRIPLNLLLAQGRDHDGLREPHDREGDARRWPRSTAGSCSRCSRTEPWCRMSRRSSRSRTRGRPSRSWRSVAPSARS